MKTGAAGLELIQRFESCVLRVYKDAAGLATIGWGHLIKPGEHFDTLTQTQADQLLAADLGGAEAIVNSNTPTGLRQNQFDALASFTFNLGFRQHVFDLVKAGDPMGVVDKMLEYRMAGGRPLEGLLRRRCAEGALYLTR